MISVCTYLTMPGLSKACPECSANVNVRKSVCECGHCFVLKRKRSVDAKRRSKRIAVRSKRALESAEEQARTIEKVFSNKWQRSSTNQNNREQLLPDQCQLRSRLQN